MCNCVNVRIQSYSNQTVLDYPEWFKSSKKVRSAGIDNCILEEIKSLWEAGIQTLESCCGHNQADGYICVVEEHIEKMEALGYKRRPHPDGCRRDIFKPKTM
jgi:hypothetical protein